MSRRLSFMLAPLMRRLAFVTELAWLDPKLLGANAIRLCDNSDRHRPKTGVSSHSLTLNSRSLRHDVSIGLPRFIEGVGAASEAVGNRMSVRHGVHRDRSDISRDRLWSHELGGPGSPTPQSMRLGDRVGRAIQYQRLRHSKILFYPPSSIDTNKAHMGDGASSSTLPPKPAYGQPHCPCPRLCWLQPPPLSHGP